MNIWHIIPTTNPGGNEVFAKNLIKNFPIKAIHTIFSTSNIDGLLSREFIRLGYLKKLFTKKSIKLIPRTLKVFHNQKPDAIIIHTFNISLIFFIIVAKLFKVRKLIIKVGNPPPSEFIFKLRIFLIVLRFLNVPLVCCSKYVLNEFKKISVLPRNSTSIRNGCELKKIDLVDNMTHKSLVKDEKFSLTMISRLDNIKNFEILIKAFLSIKNDNWQLNIVGEGEKEDFLKNLVNKLNGNKKVKFLGSRNDVLRILSNTDIFAFSTTVKEGFGIVLIEALSMGIPIIASDVPACREVLMDGKGGLLISPEDIKIWEDELTILMESENKRNLLANKAKKTSKYYDINLVAKEYLQLLNSI